MLTKQGYSVTVIEKDPTYVGGISRTVELNGFRFDIGGHRFFLRSKEVVDLWNEILPEDFIQRPRMSRIYYEGILQLPAARVRGARQSWPLALDALHGELRQGQALFLPPRVLVPGLDVNAFGHKLFLIFLKPYTEKIWGMPCDEMSADWAAQRIKGLSLWSAVVDGLKRSFGLNKAPNDGMQAKTLLESFRYPRLGPGIMWEAARDKMLTGGNSIVMGHRLKRLAQDQATGRCRRRRSGASGKGLSGL